MTSVNAILHEALQRPTCNLCGRLLNVPDDPRSVDCGGDCRACMAEHGDPDCIAALREAGIT